MSHVVFGNGLVHLGLPGAGDILGRFSGWYCHVAGWPGLDRAKPGASSPGCAEAALASGSPGDEGVGQTGQNCQAPTPPNKCVTQKNNNPGPKGCLAIGQKEACLCRAQENSGRASALWLNAGRRIKFQTRSCHQSSEWQLG